MDKHIKLSMIPVLVLLLATIAIPGQATSTHTPKPNTISSLPPRFQGITGATDSWWAAIQENLHTNTPQGLSTEPDWIGEGNQDASGFGFSVGTAGDVNGDGFTDVIIGAPFYSMGQTNEGAVAVYHGSAIGLSHTPNWAGQGDQDSAWFGYSVDTAGDVNGDGYDDVIVGAPYYSMGQSAEGVVTVYYGSATGLSQSPDWIEEGDQIGSAFGWSVSTAGDVNGDGYDDVIVGTPYYDHGNVDEGAAAVYLGSATGLSHTLSWLGESNQELSGYGFSVGTAGDVDGDGYADIIVGAHMYNENGAAAVYHGSATGLSLIPDWFTASDQGNALFGYSVGSAGDINNDGYDDVIVGAPYYDHGELDEGMAVVYCGSEGGLSLVPSWAGESNQGGSEYGFFVDSAGDVNNDSYDDVIVGASFYTHGHVEEGTAAVYLGSDSGLLIIPIWSDEGDQEGARFGYSGGAAGDVNGDGFDDVIVGAPYYSQGQVEEGAAAVYHGNGYYFCFLPVALRGP